MLKLQALLSPQGTMSGLPGFGLLAGVLAAIFLFRSRWGVLGTKTFPATAVPCAPVSFAVIAPLQLKEREGKVLAPCSRSGYWEETCEVPRLFFPLLMSFLIPDC